MRGNVSFIRLISLNSAA